MPQYLVTLDYPINEDGDPYVALVESSISAKDLKLKHEGKKDVDLSSLKYTVKQILLAEAEQVVAPAVKLAICDLIEAERFSIIKEGESNDTVLYNRSNGTFEEATAPGALVVSSPNLTVDAEIDSLLEALPLQELLAKRDEAFRYISHIDQAVDKQLDKQSLEIDRQLAELTAKKERLTSIKGCLLPSENLESFLIDPNTLDAAFKDLLSLQEELSV